MLFSGFWFDLFLACYTEHMKDILGLLFRQIKLLQHESGVSQWIFDEVFVILSFTVALIILR